MKVRDWMSAEPVTATPEMTVSQARSIMQDRGVRHLPVVDRRRHVVGIVSDRDVMITDDELRAAIRHREVPGLVDDARSVDEVMTVAPRVIADTAAVEDAARTLAAARVNALPVVDAAHRLVGIITSTDCLLAGLSAADA